MRDFVHLRESVGLSRTRQSNMLEGMEGGSRLFCELCGVTFASELHGTQHYSGRKHKLRLAGQEPLKKGYFNRRTLRWQRLWVIYFELGPLINDPRVPCIHLFSILFPPRPPLERVDASSYGEQARGVRLKNNEAHTSAGNRRVLSASEDVLVIHSYTSDFVAAASPRWVLNIV